MSRKIEIWVAVVTICVTIPMSFLAEIFFSVPAALVTGFGLTIIGLFVDLKINLHSHRLKLEGELEQMKRELPSRTGFPLVTEYLRLKDGPCPLFRSAAEGVYMNALTELRSLGSHRLRLTDMTEVYHWLEYLFCEIPMIKQIRAVSCGELAEWSDTSNWWGTSYLRIHDAAYSHGVMLQRIFIVERNRRAYDPVFRTNLAHHIDVLVATQEHVNPDDLAFAGNSIAFYDVHALPVYALVAKHDPNAQLQEMIIYGDQEDIKPIIEVHRRFESVAEPYRPSRDDAGASIKSKNVK